VNNLANDLDNNLLDREMYSGIAANSPFNTASQYVDPQKETISTPTPAMIMQMQMQQTQAQDEEDARRREREALVARRREEGGNMSTEPVPNEDGRFETGEINDGGVIGGNYGGGGGGAGMPMEEEIVIDNMARMGDDRILGLKPILFYGILGLVAAAGGYWYYKAKIKKA